MAKGVFTALGNTARQYCNALRLHVYVGLHRVDPYYVFMVQTRALCNVNELVNRVFSLDNADTVATAIQRIYMIVHTTIVQ